MPDPCVESIANELKALSAELKALLAAWPPPGAPALTVEDPAGAVLQAVSAGVAGCALLIKTRLAEETASRGE